MIEEIVSYTWLPILVALAVAVVKIEKLRSFFIILCYVAGALFIVSALFFTSHEIFNHVFRRF